MLDERQLPLGYKTLVALDRETHGQLGVAQPNNYSFSAKQHVIMVTWMEMLSASHDYPMIFIAAGNAENLMPVILTGVDEGENLFLEADGNWREDCYIPATIRRYPFYSLPHPDQTEEERKLAILVDESALSEQGEPILNKEGNPTAFWQETENFIADLDGEIQQTESFISILVGLRLLERFSYQVSVAGKEYNSKPGMLRISEERLNQLPAEKLKSLQENGSLARIHAHLLSLNNFERLYRLKAKKESKEGLEMVV